MQNHKETHETNTPTEREREREREREKESRIACEAVKRHSAHDG